MILTFFDTCIDATWLIKPWELLRLNQGTVCVQNEHRSKCLRERNVVFTCMDLYQKKVKYKKWNNQNVQFLSRINLGLESNNSGIDKTYFWCHHFIFEFLLHIYMSGMFIGTSPLRRDNWIEIKARNCPDLYKETPLPVIHGVIDFVTMTFVSLSFKTSHTNFFLTVNVQVYPCVPISLFSIPSFTPVLVPIIFSPEIHYLSILILSAWAL